MFGSMKEQFFTWVGALGLFLIFASVLSAVNADFVGAVISGAIGVFLFLMAFLVVIFSGSD